MSKEFEIECAILAALRSAPMTRVKLCSRIWDKTGGCTKFEYDPVLTKLREDGIIEYRDGIYRVSEHYKVSYYVKNHSR